MKFGKSRRRSGSAKRVLLGLAIGGALGVGLVGWRDAEPLQQQVQSLTSSYFPQTAAPVEISRDAGRKPAAVQTDPPARSFSFCHTGGGINCVVDGDTFWMEGSKIRLADIDAPETHPSRCQKEAELGAQATERLQQLLNSGPVELLAVDRDTDRYGRNLRIAMVDGKSVGKVLFEEQLVRQWNGRREPWC
jgi:endonuclease YncB( thermonuclease family)